jgi:hypothetical protein
LDAIFGWSLNRWNKYDFLKEKGGAVNILSEIINGMTPNIIPWMTGLRAERNERIVLLIKDVERGAWTTMMSESW